jgi:hypothetical protein
VSFKKVEKLPKRSWSQQWKKKLWKPEIWKVWLSKFLILTVFHILLLSIALYAAFYLTNSNIEFCLLIKVTKGNLWTSRASFEQDSVSRQTTQKERKSKQLEYQIPSSTNKTNWIVWIGLSLLVCVLCNLRKLKQKGSYNENERAKNCHVRRQSSVLHCFFFA